MSSLRMPCFLFLWSVARKYGTGRWNIALLANYQREQMSVKESNERIKEY